MHTPIALLLSLLALSDGATKPELTKRVVELRADICLQQKQIEFMKERGAAFAKAEEDAKGHLGKLQDEYKKSMGEVFNLKECETAVPSKKGEPPLQGKVTAEKMAKLPPPVIIATYCQIYGPYQMTKENEKALSKQPNFTASLKQMEEQLAMAQKAYLAAAKKPLTPEMCGK